MRPIWIRKNDTALVARHMQWGDEQPKPDDRRIELESKLIFDYWIPKAELDVLTDEEVENLYQQIKDFKLITKETSQ